MIICEIYNTNKLDHFVRTIELCPLKIKRWTQPHKNNEFTCSLFIIYDFVEFRCSFWGSSVVLARPYAREIN